MALARILCPFNQLRTRFKDADRRIFLGHVSINHALMMKHSA